MYIYNCGPKKQLYLQPQQATYKNNPARSTCTTQPRILSNVIPRRIRPRRRPDWCCNKWENRRHKMTYSTTNLYMLYIYIHIKLNAVYLYLFIYRNNWNQWYIILPWCSLFFLTSGYLQLWRILFGNIYYYIYIYVCVLFVVGEALGWGQV